MDLTLSICHDYHDYKILLTHGSAGDASSAYLADAAASSWSPSSDASRMEESDIRCLMMFNVMSWLVVDLDYMSLVAPKCHGRLQGVTALSILFITESTIQGPWCEKPWPEHVLTGWNSFNLMILVQIMVQMKDFQDKAVRDQGTSIGVLCIGVPTSSIGLRDLCDVHHLLLQWNNSKIIDTKILHRIGCCLHMFNVFFRITQNDPCILWFFWYLMSHGSSARLASSSAFACNGHSSSATCSTCVYGKWYHIVFLVLRHLDKVIVIHVQEMQSMVHDTYIIYMCVYVYIYIIIYILYMYIYIHIYTYQNDGIKWYISNHRSWQMIAECWLLGLGASAWDFIHIVTPFFNCRGQNLRTWIHQPLECW